MRKRKITTIAGAVIALVGILLESFGVELTGGQVDTLTNALVIIIGLGLTSFGPSVTPEPKDKS
jgi:uncharacterized membrane protein YqjE